MSSSQVESCPTGFTFPSTRTGSDYRIRLLRNTQGPPAACTCALGELRVCWGVCTSGCRPLLLCTGEQDSLLQHGDNFSENWEPGEGSGEL